MTTPVVLVSAGLAAASVGVLLALPATAGLRLSSLAPGAGRSAPRPARAVAAAPLMPRAWAMWAMTMFRLDERSLLQGIRAWRRLRPTTAGTGDVAPLDGIN